MKTSRYQRCMVCGEQPPDPTSWFLLAEHRWPDRLKILEWNEQLAGQPGIHCACSALHVEQLVVQWMTAGRLDYPFAVAPQQRRPGNGNRGKAAPSADSPAEEMPGARLIGELAVDRESLLRVLKESPESLTAILEALVSALRRDSCGSADQLECEELQFGVTHRAM